MRKNMIMAMVLLMLLSIQCFAELVSRDDSLHGPGSITLDTDTGLEWLDVTKTTNLSANFVTSQLVRGGGFEGFRYATIAELTTLFAHAGIPQISFGSGTLDPTNYAPVVRLLDLIGATIPSSQTFGLLGDASPFVPTNLAIGVLQAFSHPSLGLVGSADPVQASGDRNSASQTVGSFLVRVTPQRAIELLSNDVEALLQAGTLTPDQADGLIAKLDAALASLKRGNTRAACNQLGAFLNQVNAFINAGTLTASEGQKLIDAARAIRTQIGC